MAKRRVTQQVSLEFAFFGALWQFYEENRGRIRTHYRELSKRFVDFNNPDNPGAYLRRPQFEALEMYVFLKEYLENAPLHEAFQEWRVRQGKFQGRKAFETAGQGSLFAMVTEDQYGAAFDLLAAQLATGRRDYANYIFALTMGTGKTILMATCIFYEFLLANKFPKDPKYCHNALVFAPDTTVLEALREIQTFDMARVVPPEYVNWLTTHIQFHFLDEAGMALSTMDRSMFNLIISNTQKVILKRQHAEKSPTDQLFRSGRPTYQPGTVYDEFSDVYELDEADTEEELTTNQRFEKLRRLGQLGIYVDEAHHAFGTNLAKDVGAVEDDRKTSLRLTIDELARSLARTGSHVVACYNYTGTPYADNQVLPEVVYAYGLKEAIDKAYLKNVLINGYRNVRNEEFVDEVVKDFIAMVGDGRHEGMLPKLALFAATIDELETRLRPAVEAALAKRGISTGRILVNHSEASNDDVREFNALDRPSSEKQYVLLVGKGREGWNCRSLFGVALFRRPKSKIFVLQATMRCLRAVGEGQQTGHVYLSDENKQILEDELRENFRVTLGDIENAGQDRKPYEVHVAKPPVTVKIQRVRHLFKLLPKEMARGADLELDKADTEKYRLTHDVTNGLLGDSARVSTEDITHVRERRKFSRLTLVAEIARYLNMPCLEVEEVLEKTQEGTARILDRANEYNELLYDWVIPKLFKHLYDMQESERKEEEEIALVKEPEGGHYMVHADPTKVVCMVDPVPGRVAESFHLDTYCFDSAPEHDLFLRLLKDKRVHRVYFTGMLTHGQSEFYVQYIDPDTHALRSYYPDFLLQRADGPWVILEVKRDDWLQKPVVLAKAEHARKLAVASGMTYGVLKGSECRSGDYGFVLKGEARPESERWV